jgi:hypothetical protein
MSATSSGGASAASSAASAASASSAVSSGGSATPAPAAPDYAADIATLRAQLAAIGSTVADHTAGAAVMTTRLGTLETDHDALAEEVEKLKAPAEPAPLDKTTADRIDFILRVLRKQFPAELAPGDLPAETPTGPRVNYVRT